MLANNEDIKRLLPHWKILKTWDHNDNNTQQTLAYYILDVLSTRMKGVVIEDIAILLGDPADLCATVVAPSHKAMFKFVTEHLRPTVGIENTSTSHVAWRIDPSDLTTDSLEPSDLSTGDL